MAAKNMNDIAEIFRNMKFRKRLFGGVEERDVWRQLDELQKAYRSAYEAQATRYQALLAAHGIKVRGAHSKAAGQPENGEQA